MRFLGTKKKELLRKILKIFLDIIYKCNQNVTFRQKNEQNEQFILLWSL